MLSAEFGASCKDVICCRSAQRFSPIGFSSLLKVTGDFGPGAAKTLLWAPKAWTGYEPSQSRCSPVRVNGHHAILGDSSFGSRLRGEC